MSLPGRHARADLFVRSDGMSAANYDAQVVPWSRPSPLGDSDHLPDPPRPQAVSPDALPLAPKP